MNQDTMISEMISQYLPQRFRFRCGDTTFCVSALGALVLIVFVVVNLGSAPVWLFGASVSVPLSVQWLLAFVAGGVVSLRIKHMQHLRHARNAAAEVSRTGHPMARPTVLAPPLRSAANASRFSDPARVRPAHGGAQTGTSYSQRVG
jgi:uncharacterized integral membrane protein